MIRVRCVPYSVVHAVRARTNRRMHEKHTKIDTHFSTQSIESAAGAVVIGLTTVERRHSGSVCVCVCAEAAER